MTTTTNPILVELHAVRQRLLAVTGGTLDARVDRLQAEEHRASRKRFEPGGANAFGAAKSGELAEEKHSSPPGDR
jgi:hypothetical protein